MPADATMLDAAIAYARDKSWLVFPVHSLRDGRCSCGKGDCEQIAKHPRTPNGFKDATLEEDKIRAWWKRWPDANIGVATGAASGFVVVDVDGELGEQTLDEHQHAYGELPETARAITGGDGSHYLFAHPDEVVRNSAKKKLGPGLDVRGDGGYIVVAPSIHRSGQRYEWLATEPLAPMPGWVLEKLRDPVPAAGAAPAAPGPRPISGGTPYALEALSRETTEVRSCTPDSHRRNDQLNESAFALAQLVAGGELEEGLVWAELRAAGLAVGLGASEIEKTIASGMEGGKKQPRRAPERPDRAQGGPRPAGPLGNGKPNLRLVAGGEGDPPAPGTPDEGGGRRSPDSDEHFTDLGNANRMVALHGTQLRFVDLWGKWLVWDGTRWCRDETAEIYRRARSTVDRLFRQAANEGGVDRKAATTWAMKSEGARGLEAMVRLAQSDKQVAAHASVFDADPWALNVMNGTLDLRSGHVRPHNPDDNITKLAPVVYDPEAVCPTWLEFLESVFAGDGEVIDFVQRAVGYSLSGSVREQVLFFLFGAGSNGKSTFLGTLQAVLGGDFACQTAPDLLVSRYGDQHPTSLAALVGKRMAVTVEVQEGRYMDESLVKQLTGGDPITARFMRQDFFTFAPTHKLWLAANHKPLVRGTDYAIWRRIRLVPFGVTFAAEDRDPDLQEKLLAEAPGILAWAVEGCKRWLRHGLSSPRAVVEATAEYRDDMDILGQFLSERCEVSEQLEAAAADLYAVYKSWCDETGEKVQSQHWLGRRLTEKGFERFKGGRRNAYSWRGLATLATEWGRGADLSEPLSRGADLSTSSDLSTSRARDKESYTENASKGPRRSAPVSSSDTELPLEGNLEMVDEALPCTRCEVGCYHRDAAGRAIHPLCLEEEESEP